MKVIVSRANRWLAATVAVCVAVSTQVPDLPGWAKTPLATIIAAAGALLTVVDRGDN